MAHPELHQLFTDELYKMNWFENALTKTLYNLGRSSDLVDLEISCKKKRAYSQEHVNRISKIFNSLDEPFQSVQSKAASGMIADLTAACSQAKRNDIVCNIFLILVITKAANYKLGAYSGILKLANAMQYHHAEGLLIDTIIEEKQIIAELLSYYQIIS